MLVRYTCFENNYVMKSVVTRPKKTWLDTKEKQYLPVYVFRT